MGQIRTGPRGTSKRHGTPVIHLPQGYLHAQTEGLLCANEQHQHIGAAICNTTLRCQISADATRAGHRSLSGGIARHGNPRLENGTASLCPLCRSARRRGSTRAGGFPLAGAVLGAWLESSMSRSGQGKRRPPRSLLGSMPGPPGAMAKACPGACWECAPGLARHPHCPPGTKSGGAGPGEPRLTDSARRQSAQVQRRQSRPAR